MMAEAEPRPEPSWDYNDLVLFVFLSLLCLAFTQGLVWAAIRLLHVAVTDRALVLLPSQVILYALLLGALTAIIKLQYGRPFWRSLAWVDFQFETYMATVAGFALAIFNSVVSMLLHPPNIDTPLRHLLERRSTAIEFGLLGITLAPVCEELVFRGFMQPVFVRSLGPGLGILVTAILFGSLHLAQNGFAWQSGLMITFAGLAFGWMRHLSHSTKASTMMHAAYNTLLFVATFSSPGNHAAQ